MGIGPSEATSWARLGPADDFHRVPEQSGSSGNVVDVDDVGVIQPGGELRFAAEALDRRRILGQVRMQYLEGDFALQVQVAHPVDAAEPALTEHLEQLVVVTQRSAKPWPPTGDPRPCRQTTSAATRSPLRTSPPHW